MEIPYTVKPRPDTGLYNAKLGIWLFLASEVMLFGALFSSYVLLRVGAEPGTWSMGLMDLFVGAGNTMVLIASSMFVVLAWAELKQGNLARIQKMEVGDHRLRSFVSLCKMGIRVALQVQALRRMAEQRDGAAREIR